jgi:hypothetical protein
MVLSSRQITQTFRLMYRFSVFICFLFARLVIALFTLIIGDGSFEPASDRGTTLVQDLTAVRI